MNTKKLSSRYSTRELESLRAKERRAYHSVIGIDLVREEGIDRLFGALETCFLSEKEASLANQSNAKINKEINTACCPKLCIDLVVKSHANQLGFCV